MISIMYPRNSNNTSNNIVGKDSSNIRLYSSYGVDVKVYKDHVTLTSHDPEKLREVNRSISDSIANTISVYAHPKSISQYMIVNDNDRFKLTLYRSDIRNLYRLTKIQSNIRNVITEKYSNNVVRKYERQNVINNIKTYLTPTSKIKILLGRVCYYDSNRHKEISNKLLNTVYTFSTWSTTTIGYKQDIKSRWVSDITSQQHAFLLNAMTKTGFKEEKSSDRYVVSIVDTNIKRRIIVSIDCINGNIITRYEKKIPSYTTVTRLDSRPDVRIKVTESNDQEVDGLEELITSIHVIDNKVTINSDRFFLVDYDRREKTSYNDRNDEFRIIISKIGMYYQVQIKKNNQIIVGSNSDIPALLDYALNLV